MNHYQVENVAEFLHIEAVVDMKAAQDSIGLKLLGSLS